LKVSGASTSGGPKGVVVAYGDQNSDDVASDVAAESVMQVTLSPKSFWPSFVKDQNLNTRY
jgi:hypothetical protein